MLRWSLRGEVRVFGVVPVERAVFVFWRVEGAAVLEFASLAVELAEIAAVGCAVALDTRICAGAAPLPSSWRTIWALIAAQRWHRATLCSRLSRSAARPRRGVGSCDNVGFHSSFCVLRRLHLPADLV